MSKIATHRLTPGMRLSLDVQDITGRLLLGRGVQIGEKHINLLMMWGVAEVEIEGAPNENDEVCDSLNMSAECLAEAQNELLDIFVHNDLENPFMKQLFSFCLARRAKELARGTA